MVLKNLILFVLMLSLTLSVIHLNIVNYNNNRRHIKMYKLMKRRKKYRGGKFDPKALKKTKEIMAKRAKEAKEAMAKKAKEAKVIMEKKAQEAKVAMEKKKIEMEKYALEQAAKLKEKSLAELVNIKEDLLKTKGELQANKEEELNIDFFRKMAHELKKIKRRYDLTFGGLRMLSKTEEKKEIEDKKTESYTLLESAYSILKEKGQILYCKTNKKKSPVMSGYEDSKKELKIITDFEKSYKELLNKDKSFIQKFLSPNKPPPCMNNDEPSPESAIGRSESGAAPVPAAPVPAAPVPTAPMPSGAEPVPAAPVPTAPMPSGAEPVPAAPVPTAPMPSGAEPVPTAPVPSGAEPVPAAPVPTAPVPSGAEPTAVLG